MGWTGHAACMRAKRNTYKILTEKLERQRSVWRSRGTWEYIIKMDLKETIYGGETGFIWLRIRTSEG
jgi:hypothetical protein